MPCLGDAGVALAQLGLDEFGGRSHDDLGIEARHQFLEQVREPNR